MARLLVSVRNVDEARAALEGGADLIDVKEPARGPLGRADADVLQAVVRFVKQRRLVSAACGDLEPASAAPSVAGLNFVKWGLAQLRHADWQAALITAGSNLPEGCQPVAVAYADADNAHSPAVDDVLRFAISRRWPLLVDTFEKQGQTLVDWLGSVQVAQLVHSCQQADIPVALAGALTTQAIQTLTVWPDWIAVRSAACRSGQREQSVCGQRVRELADLVHAGAPVCRAIPASLPHPDDRAVPGSVAERDAERIGVAKNSGN